MGCEKESRNLKHIQFPAAQPQTYWFSLPFLLCRCVQDSSCPCCRVYVQDLLWASLSSKEPFYPMCQSDLQFQKLVLKCNRPVNLIRVSQDDREGGRNWRSRTLCMWQNMFGTLADVMQYTHHVSFFECSKINSLVLEMDI